MTIIAPVFPFDSWDVFKVGMAFDYREYFKVYWNPAAATRSF